MTMSSFVVNAATGKFNPEIALNDLGSVTVSGIPDFLLGGNVVVDLYNPQIKLTMTSDMSVPGMLDGVIKSFKDGQLLATVNVMIFRLMPTEPQPYAYAAGLKALPASTMSS